MIKFNNNENNLYVIITASSTKIGKVIRCLSRYNYSHSAISTNKLQSLYSFSRFQKNTPFESGFMEESLKRYLDSNEKLPIMIFEIPLTSEQKNKLDDTLNKLNENKKDYRYNFVSLFIAPFRKRYELEKAFTCLQFVNYILNELNITNKKFINFKEMHNELKKYLIYNDDIHNLEINASIGNDTYYNKKSFLGRCIDAIKYNKKYLYYCFHRKVNMR